MARRLGLLLLPVFFLFIAWPTLGSDDAHDLFERGRELMADRNYDGAARVLTDLTRRHPGAAEADEALLLLGKAHLYGGKFPAAVAAFERLLKDMASSAWAKKARLLLADAYTAQGRHDLASDILRRRLETVEGRAYKVMLADHYLKVADTAFEGTPSTDPLKKGEKVRDLKKAIRYFSRARDLLREEREEAELTVKIARAHFDDRNPGKTVETLADFFKRFPDFASPAEVRLLKARAHQNTGQTKKARAEIKDFLKTDGLFLKHPLRPEALQLAAETHFKEGGERAVLKGVTVLAGAIQAYPDHALTETLAFRVGEALYGAGKLKEAIAALTLFRDRYPRSERAPDAQLHIAEAHHHRKAYEAARSAWRAFIGENPNHPAWATAQRRIVEALYTRAADLRRAGESEGALTAFKAFLAEYPADKLSPQAQVNVAELHEKAERLEAALEAYRIVATRYAGLDRNAAASSQFKRAEILRLKKENLTGAMEALKDLLKRFPGTGEARKARSLIARLFARSLKVETERVFSLQEAPRLKVATRNIEKLSFKAYPLNLVEYFKRKHRIDRIESVEVPIIKPAVEWTVEVKGYARFKDIERPVPLDRLKGLAARGGAFILAVRGEDLETRTLVLLSDLTLVLKKSPRQGLVFVLDETAGRPASGVDVLMSDGRKIVGTGKTDREGVFVKRFGKFVPGLQVLVHRGGHTAHAGGSSRSAYTFGYKTKAYLYTDRPRYRPGHRVQFKGIVRKVVDGVYRTPKNSKTQVKVLDSRGAILLEKEMKVNAFGTLSGEVVVGSAAPLGTYRITARFDKQDFQTTFEVAEYKKPDMFARIKPGRPDYLNGERVEAVLEAGYFFGGPAKRAAVRWRVYRRSFSFDAAAYKDYAWFFEEKKADKKSGGGPGEHVASGAGVTDDEGRFKFAFDTGDREGDWRYTVVAEVQGRGRTVAYGSSVFFVTERAYYAVVRADKKAYQPKEDIRISVTTVNARHEPVSRTGTVELRRLGRGKQGPTETVAATAPVTTGKDGKGEVKLRAPRGGDYRVAFKGEDRRGETVLGQARVAVSGEAEDLSRQARIVAEREIYYAGDRAQVLVNTPRAPAHVLLTFEGERVLDHKVILLERRSNLLRLEMKGDYAPNVFLRVAIPADHKLYEDEDEVLVFKFLNVKVTPDRTEYRPGDKVKYAIQATDPKGKPVQAEVSLAVVDRSLLEIAPETVKAVKPFFYDQKRRRSVATSSSLTFKYVAATKKVDPDLLGMEARDKFMKEMQSREELAKKAVAATPTPTGAAAPSGASRAARLKSMSKWADAKPGARVAAEKNKSEAVGFHFASKRLERRAHKKGKRPAKDAVMDRLVADREQAEMEDAEPMQDAPFERGYLGDRAAAALQAVKVRRRFLDTAAFLPHVETDENGKAEVEVTLPDNLTAWRAKAVGVGGDALVGSGETVCRSVKPLVARIDLPRFLTQGDRVRAASVLHNNTNRSENLEVSFTAEGAKLESPARASTALPPFEAGRLDWDLTAPDPGVVKFTLKAVMSRKDGHSDGMETAIPVLPFGEHGRTAYSATTAESAVIQLTLPDALIPDASRFTLLLSPGYDTVLLDGLDYLGGFPYGCIEQTVSRFLPAVAAAGALARLGIDDPARAARLEKQVRAGLNRLYHMQHPDGGWGWWFRKMRGGAAHCSSDPRMTAYALLGLEVANRSGYAVDPNVLGRARTLARSLAQKVSGYDLRAALLHALSVGGAASTSDLGRAYRYRDLLTVSGISRLALAYSALNRPRYAENLVALLKERALESGGHVRWKYAATGKGAWDRSEIENTAYALMALLRVDPSSRLVEPALAYLMHHRTGRSFRSTKDTAAVILALTEYMARRNLEQPTFDLVVEVNGKKAAEVHIEQGRIADRKRYVSLDASLFKAGANTVRLKKAGPGKIHYAFIADYHGPAESVQARGNLLKVKRCYSPHVDPSAMGEDWVKPGWSVVMEKFRPTKEKTPSLKQVLAGDKVKVALDLEAREAAAYVVVEDPLPAGFEVMAGSARGAFDRFERRDNRAVFFFSSLKGKVNVSYVIRAIHPGAYRTLPTFASPMYEPEIWGRAASAPLTVVDPRDGVDIARARAEPTADELYYGALKDLGKKRKAAALKKLRAVRKYRLQDEIHDEVLAHLVKLELGQHPKNAVSAFEELQERNPRKAAFDRATRIRLAHAYHGLKEHERSSGFYRQLLGDSFQAERALVSSYIELGKPARAQAVLLQVLRRYPDANEVVSATYQRGLQFAEIRQPDLKPDPYLKVAAPTMRMEALRELKAFTGFYPRSPLADDAQYHVVKLLQQLKVHDRAVQETKRFYSRYPKSSWLDDVMFLEVQSLYAAGHYAASLEAGHTLVSRRFPREDGRKGTVWSPWRDHTLYLHGKIKHIQGDLKTAVSYYRRVAGKFEDARDAMSFFTRTQLEVEPSRSMAVDQVPTIELTLKNIRSVRARIYPVDLKVLFAVRKNLSNVNAIDLTGIPAVATFERNLERPPEYKRFTRKVRLPIKEKGVYLVVLKAGNRDATTIVVLSDLDLKVQRVGRKIRAYVSRRSTGIPVAGAFVRIADGHHIKAEGPTDPRGVFEGPNIQGKASIVVEHEGSFAFHQESAK